jgi:hypothetical protein
VSHHLPSDTALTWRSHPGGYWVAYAPLDGAAYEIARILTEGPRGGQRWEYEVEVTRDGRTRTHEGIMRFDSAKALAQRLHDDHLSGADR